MLLSKRATKLNLSKERLIPKETTFQLSCNQPVELELNKDNAVEDEQVLNSKFGTIEGNELGLNDQKFNNST